MTALLWTDAAGREQGRWCVRPPAASTRGLGRRCADAADVLLISGDLARPEQAREVACALAPIGIPEIAALGSHVRAEGLQSPPVNSATDGTVSQRGRRLAAFSGILYAVFLVLGEALPREVGIRFELVGHVLLLFFIGYLTTVLSSERSVTWLASTALGAAAAATAVKLVSAAPFLVAYREPADSEAARTLGPMSDALFIFTMIPLAAMTAAIACAVIWARTLPLWIGLSAALLSVALLVNGMFIDAAFGAAFILFLIWTVAVSVYLLVRRDLLRATNA